MPVTHRKCLELRRLERDSHDKCSHCGRRFEKGDATHSGYLEDGAAAFVCYDCASLLVETSDRRAWSPLPYEQPPGDSVIWRYVDLAKFIALLKDRALYFARADRLGDPFEGAKGSMSRKELWDARHVSFFQSALRDGWGERLKLSEAEIEAKGRALLRELEELGAGIRGNTFVSCWHESVCESDALWAKYAGHANLAIAMRTTVDRLRKSLGDDPTIKIGRVKYLDFGRDFAGFQDAFFTKRRSFQHEREVRALVEFYPKVQEHGERVPEEGRLVPVDVNELIETVVVSPLAEPWFTGVVQEVVARFKCRAAVRHSELLDTPFF